MFFRDVQHTSLGPKSLIAGALTVSFIASTDILIGGLIGASWWDNPYRVTGNGLRAGLLVACLGIYLLRIYATLFVFFQRILMWREAVIVANIMPWCFLYVAYYGGRHGDPVGLVEAAGLALYAFGSYLNTAGEWVRHRWKKDPAHAGQLYTGGLFSRVRHVNYTGDIILFSGIALVAHEYALLLIPLGMAVLFIVVLAPLKELYLKRKYGRQFENYAARSKMLIPMVV